ncbi:MAG: 2Fe-2S iron-sulfur cluster-binding protein, partial [Alphaproteobacteria bacterium]|nr:2Fe-2S iron-sulfur cluster-binding protein [Alphaproteobacteria bacterium]
MSGFRLQDKGRLNRNSKIEFEFDGLKISGFEGDSFASALMAAGHDVVGRSFKYHRPRGIMAAGQEEPNAIAQIVLDAKEEPNIRLTTTLAKSGAKLQAVNCWPTARRDYLAATGLLKRFFVSGFYYKVFKWPSWKFWSPIVRQMAGLGTLPKDIDTDRYDHKYAHFDKLVVGAGPSGISAALESANAGEKVLLVEQDFEIGGALLFETGILDGQETSVWLAEKKQQLEDHENITILTNSTALGYYDDNLITVSQRLVVTSEGDRNPPREILWHVVAKQVTLATGAIERPLVFGNNDIPGVMLASAVRSYIRRYEVAPGKNLVVATNNDDAYRTAFAAIEAGLNVSAIVDARKQPPAALAEKISEYGIELFSGYLVTEAKGKNRISGVVLHKYNADRNEIGSEAVQISCDILAISGGYSPVVHLFSQSGGKLKFDEGLAGFVPDHSPQEVKVVGAATGDFAAHAVLSHKAFADVTPILPVWDIPDNQPFVSHLKRWVDFQHDVTASDVALAARENYISVEHFKRYTTTGMAMDQGKTSNINALAILGLQTNREIPEVGTTKFRPPYTPATIGAFAGRNKGKLFKPLRYLHIHDWHEKNGATFDEYGIWTRPAC